MSTGQNPNGSSSGNASPAATTTACVPAPSPNIDANTRKTVLFVGWGRSGKDEAAQFAERHLGLRYGGSFSWHAKEHIAWLLGVHPMTAWETRHQNRQFWKDECDKLRAQDQTYLAKCALASGDIVAGLRDKVELEAVIAEGLFDRIVWIDRPGVPEDFTVTYTREDVVRAGGSVIINDGTLEDYHKKLIVFFRFLDVPLRMSSYAIRLANEL